jgi:hypothetical protein
LGGTGIDKLMVCSDDVNLLDEDINNGCKVNVDYEPPENVLVKDGTYVGVKE